MKKRVIVFLVLLIFIPIFAYSQGYYNADELGINLKITGDFEINADGGDSSIRYIIANLSFFPRSNYRQEVVSIKTTPETEIREGIAYRWEEPELGKYEFVVESEIKTKNKRNEVKGKVEFPIRNIPKEFIEYTKPTLTIDSDNEKVVLLANSIAGGEDDLFIVAHELAKWTKDNVEYNLTTLTVSVSEPASWVLENKKGVCDEITNLFIALCRSLGIPARFVAGVAYSDSPLFTEKWGPHGWAEVYFPGYGWVDYDVTFGEFGYIDPVHIKLKDSIDATQSSTRYSWLGHSVDIKPGQLSIAANIIEHVGEFNGNVEISAYPEKEEIGQDSYNIINVKLKNNNEYYVSEGLYLYASKEVIAHESNIKELVLKPGEEKTLGWIIQISEVEPGYMYTFPITIKDSLNRTFKTEFRAVYGGLDLDREEANRVMESKTEKTEKKYSKDINLSCEPEKKEFYTYENNTLKCIVKNNGNFFFDEINVCFKEECKKIELGISQEKTVEFVFNEEKEGKKEREVRAESKDALQTLSIEYNALDQPKIEIEEIIYPKEVTYKEDYTMEFLMKKSSFSNPVDIDVILNQGGYEKTWSIDEMQQDRKFMIDMKGSNMVEGENKFGIKINFKDRLGNEYEEVNEITIQLVNLTIPEKVIVLSNHIGKGILSRRGFINFISITGIAFILIFWIVFKKGDSEKRKKDERGKKS